jgi:hypothetical protein
VLEGSSRNTETQFVISFFHFFSIELCEMFFLVLAKVEILMLSTNVTDITQDNNLSNWLKQASVGHKYICAVIFNSSVWL